MTSAISAPDSATIRVVANGREFSFGLAELKAAGRLSFLDGDVAAVYTPPTRSLTLGEASQHDFPSVATQGDRAYAAWVTYQNEGNFVYLAVREKNTWTVKPATSAWRDYYGSAVATDASGRAYVVWGEYKDDRWRLVCRVYDPAAGQWSAEQYVAPSGRRQMFHRMTTDAQGAPWAVWQEYVNGGFDIFAARHGAGGWEAPLRISESSANDWSPAITASPDGSVYVAWDGYEGGSYDIYLRRIQPFQSSRDGKLGPVERVTRSHTFNAHVSIAADAKNRVWLAWDESGANWGKDTGVIAKTGTALHASRKIRVVRYENGSFTEPVQSLAESLPGWLQPMNEYPALAIGANGMPYLFFRHFLARIPMAEDQRRLQIGDKAQTLQPWYDTVRQVWDVYATAFDGANWLPARELPVSTGRCYMQTSVAMQGQTLLYFWPSDGRTYEDPHVRTAQLRYAEFPTADKVAGTERMKPFRSEPSNAPDAAPTEKQDVAAIRTARWQALRLYRGDLHRHTDISADADRDGDILDTYRYALDSASLDFMAITDHSGAQRLNYYRYDWWRNRQIATLFDNPGHFVTFFGYERTVTYPGGHRNVISASREAQPFRISDEEFSGVESYGARLFPYLKSRSDIAIPHTTATGGGTNWNANDAQVEPVVEIFQGLRGSYEEPKTPSKGVGMNHQDGLVWNAWSRGRRVGVIASSDHQSTHESFACVWAPELTRAAILGALKSRRTFGATDAIIIKFEAAGRDGKVHHMGEEFAAAEAPELRVDIRAAGPVARLEVIRNGSIVHSQAGGAAAHFTYRDAAPLSGVNYYHIRVVQENSQIAWSSPIWVNLP